MVANILKYRSDNLITFYYYIYSSVVATTYYNNKWLYKAVNLLEWDIKWGIHKRTRQGVSS